MGALVLLSLGGGGLAPLASRTTAGAAPLRIVFASGCVGAYSIRPDGSRLTPLVPRSRSFAPGAISRDGSTVAYIAASNSRSIYVSRASGSRVRRIGRFTRYGVGEMALSRDGRLLAFANEGIRIVGTDGRGFRRISSGRDDDQPDWSPDRRALVFTHSFVSRKASIVLQPLHGRRRVLVRRGGSAKWSPDGRWIAYRRERGNKPDELWVVRPDGSGRRRLATDAAAFAWSPDSRRLAFSGYRRGLRLVDVDGRGLRRLRLRPSPYESAPNWSPDGRLIAFAGSGSGERPELWVIGRDGNGLRRLTSGCGSTVLGWTRLAPILAPDPPPERVLGADTLATRDPVDALAADGARVGIIVQAAPTACEHVAVWTPERKAVERLATPTPCRTESSGGSFLYGLEIAGTRAAWVSAECGNFCDTALLSATLASPHPLELSTYGSFDANGDVLFDYHLHGDGDLLVFDEETRLVRVGAGNEHCEERNRTSASICTTLRRGADAAPIDAVSAGLIAVREPDQVSVLDGHGTLVRRFPFAPDEVSAARLDGGHLVIARLGVIDSYDVASGSREASRPLPDGYELTDADGGITVLEKGRSIMLLRLADGHSTTLRPERGPVFAQLEPPGLYYSYTAAAGGGRVVVMRRARLERQLG